MFREREKRGKGSVGIVDGFLVLMGGEGFGIFLS